MKKSLPGAKKEVTENQLKRSQILKALLNNAFVTSVTVVTPAP